MVRISVVGAQEDRHEFVRDLLRREQDRERLRNLLLDGAASESGPAADTEYFESLRERVCTAT
jgi:antitoxin ParD1/3/4